MISYPLTIFLLFASIPVTLHQEEARTLYQQGLALVDSGKVEEASMVLEKAVVLHPLFTEARLILFELQKEKGLHELAEQTLWEGLRWQPGDLRLRKALYHVLVGQDRHAEAADLIWLGVEMSEGRDVETLRLAQMAKEGTPDALSQPIQRPLISLPPDELPEEAPTGRVRRPLGVEAGLSYSLFVPEGYHKKNRWPLVIGLHDSGIRAESYMELIRVSLGQNEDILLACPQAPTTQSISEKNEILAQSDWTRETVDFIVYALLVDLLSVYRVDLERVLLLGIGSGAVHSYGLALAHPDFFQGVVVVYAGLPAWTEEHLAAARSLRVLLLAPEEKSPLFPVISDSARRLEDVGARVELLSTNQPAKVFPIDQGPHIMKWWNAME